MVLLLPLAYELWDFGSHPGQVPVTRAIIKQVCDALAKYRTDTGNYPSQTDGLSGMATNWLPATPIDAWGHPFRYRIVAGQPSVVSAGPDGVFDTKDDIK